MKNVVKKIAPGTFLLSNPIPKGVKLPASYSVSSGGVLWTPTAKQLNLLLEMAQEFAELPTADKKLFAKAEAEGLI
jgi:hypothetical protein